MKPAFTGFQRYASSDDNVSGGRNFYMLQRNESLKPQHATDLQCFAGTPILPVAVSGSHKALPRSEAWHL
jgi:hypothetical protein